MTTPLMAVANETPDTPTFHSRMAMIWLEEATRAGLIYRYLRRRWADHPHAAYYRAFAIRCLAQAGRSMAASMPRYRR
jgi:hypothetical protein